MLSQNCSYQEALRVNCIKAWPTMIAEVTDITRNHRVRDDKGPYVSGLCCLSILFDSLRRETLLSAVAPESEGF